MGESATQARHGHIVGKSQMGRIYTNLSDQEVDAKYDAMTGKAVEQVQPKGLVESKVCLRCQAKNKPTNVSCESCGISLNPAALVDDQEMMEKAIAKLAGLLSKLVEQAVEEKMKVREVMKG